MLRLPAGSVQTAEGVVNDSEEAIRVVRVPQMLFFAWAPKAFAAPVQPPSPWLLGAGSAAGSPVLWLAALAASGCLRGGSAAGRAHHFTTGVSLCSPLSWRTEAPYVPPTFHAMHTSGLAGSGASGVKVVPSSPERAAVGLGCGPACGCHQGPLSRAVGGGPHAARLLPLPALGVSGMRVDLRAASPPSRAGHLR